MPVTIDETTVVANGNGSAILLVEIHDGAITNHQDPIPVPPETNRAVGAVYAGTNPKTGRADHYRLVGPNRDYRVFYPKPPDAYLNRAAAKTASAWKIAGPSGAVSVTAVKPQTSVRQSTSSVSDYVGLASSYYAMSQMKHLYRLVLDRELVPGTYTITPPAGTALAPYRWTYDDRVTRCSAMRVNQVGFRPGDKYKKGLLAAWLPYGANGGVVDFADYGKGPGTPFHVINAIGSIVYSGTLRKRCEPDVGAAHDPQVHLQADFGSWKKTMTGFSGSNPPRLTVPSHGLRNGDVIATFGCGGENPQYSNIGHNFFMVQNASADEFDAWWATAAWKISNTNPAVVTCYGTDLPPGNGATIKFGAVEGMTELSFTTQVVTNHSRFRTFTLQGVNAIRYGAFRKGCFAMAAPPFVRGAKYPNTNFAANVHPPEMNNLILPATIANYAGTYVYDMDISDWTDGAPGTYRFYIPGLGVSYPFTIDEAAWLEVTKVGSQGLYNNMNGIEIDGRAGGYKRPQNATDGLRGRTLYWSRVPFELSSEGASMNGITYKFRQIVNGDAMLTNERLTGLAATVTADAGDLDFSLDDHGVHHHDKLALGVLHLPQEVRAAIPHVFPKLSSFDPDFYAGTDDLPAPAHEAILVWDFLRRAQRKDGSIPSGLGLATPPTGSGGNIYGAEISSITRGQWFVNAADHASGYVGVAGFAKCAEVFYLYGMNKQGDAYAAAAAACFNWCKTLDDSWRGDKVAHNAYYRDTLGLMDGFTGNGVRRATAVDASADIATVGPHGWSAGRKVVVRKGYATAALAGGLNELGVYYVSVPSPTSVSFHTSEAAAITGTGKVDLTNTAAGWEICACLTQAEFDAMMASLNNNAASRRLMAWGALWKMDRKTYAALGRALEAIPYGPVGHGISGFFDGYFVSSNTAWKNGIKAGMTRGSISGTTPYALWALSNDTPFPHLGNPATRVAFGNALIRAHILDPTDDRHLGALRVMMSFALGANQLGLCTIYGLGHRNTYGYLHNDSTGRVPNPPNGLGLYMYDVAWGLTLPGGNSFMGRDADPFWSTHYLFNSNIYGNPNYAANHCAAKLTEPPIHAMPYYEQCIEQQSAIYCMEFRTIENILPLQVLAYWLHGWDGNPATGPSAPRYRLRLNWAN